MQDRKLSPPQVKGYDQAYELSYQLAREKLATNTDLEAQCRRSGAECRLADSPPRIVLAYMGRPHVIGLPEVEISAADGAEPVALKDKLLMLHYFNTARGTPPADRLVTFRELPDGPVYFPTFTKRAIKPIVDSFGRDPERLVVAAAKLNGRRVAQGDMGIAFDAFPRVTVTVVLWKGDDEFPPDGSVLLDASVIDYLPTEDITILCETIAWRLVRLKGED
jgi:hypothetical protein